jgi:NAD(P)-dependent dehydrogenase (short-subunit alcohol dehydrogenase family)
MVSCTYQIGHIGPHFFTNGRESDSYWRIPVYSNTKLALWLFTRELSERLRQRHISVNAADPGIVSTGKISTLLNEEIILNGNVSAVLKKIGKYDITTFANRLSILNLNEKLVQAIKDERIDYTRAKIINSKLKDEEKIVKIIDYVEKNKLSSKKLSEYIDEEFLMANKNKKDVEVFSFINDIKDVRKKINGIKDKEKQAFINEKMAEIEKLYSLIKEQIN